MDDINATIRELEEQIASYELELSKHSHSTPLKAMSTPSKTAMDSGFETARTVVANEPAEQAGARRKSVRFEGQSHDVCKSNTESDEYDLSPYLNREDRNVTLRKPQTRWSMSSVRPQYETHSSGTARGRQNIPNIKPATYDGSTSWLDYKSHFEACAKLCQWDDEAKCLYLSVSLRGSAQGVLGNISDGREMSYKELVSALDDRFAPPDQIDLYRTQLRERKQRASESIPELGQHIRRLVNLAYPTVPADVKETLAKDHFIEALAISDMRLRIKQARPKNLNEALRHAIELEAFLKTEQRLGGSGSSIRAVEQDSSGTVTNELSKVNDTILELKKSMSTITKELRELKERDRKQTTDQKSNRNADWRKDIECYRCGKKGHIQRECRLRNGGNNTTQSSPQKKSWKTKSTSPENHQGKVGVSGEGGIFIKGYINDLEFNFLVDSGATLSLLSKDAFNRIHGNDSTDMLHEVNAPVLQANSDPLNTHGQLKTPFKIKDVIYNTMTIVTDLSVDAILGLDFLMENKCVIDMTAMELRIDGTAIPLIKRGYIGCYRIATTETVHVPPRSEIVTSCGVCTTSKEQIAAGIGLIEGDENFLKSEKSLIGKVLVTTKESVPVRFMNPGFVVQTIHKGTVVAKLTPVQCVVGETESPSESPEELTPALEELLQRSSERLNPDQKQKLKSLLLRNANLFARDDKDFGRTDVIKHSINTGSRAPIRQTLRRTPVHWKHHMDNQLKDMLKADVIERSASPWASGVVLVQKKDGSVRFCVDYRKLNDITVKDAYPLPRIDETLDHLSGARWFSTLDLSSGYWQVEMEPDDRPKTAFVTSKGLYQFKVMPFGLCNAPATFERLMETVLCGLQWDICLIYLDDVIVFGKTFDEMTDSLQKVFDRLHTAGLKLKAKKCTLYGEQVEYLGHIISKTGVATDPKKVEAIKSWPEPSSVKDVRSFLGLCGYYRRYVKDFSKIAKPLHKLTNKGAKFQWTEECQSSFDKLKAHLVSAPILAFPDFSQTFIVDTDASDMAIGAVLSQNQGNSERVIAYASRTLSKSERMYCVTKKELLAVVYFVKQFRHYLYGRKFTIRTDHGSLRWLPNFKQPEGHLA